MSILIDENTKVVVQGLTGREGQFHGLRNRDYGTKVVAGTRPGKGGEEIEGIPIFDSVKEAISVTGDLFKTNLSIIKAVNKSNDKRRLLLASKIEKLLSKKGR